MMAKFNKGQKVRIINTVQRENRYRIGMVAYVLEPIVLVQNLTTSEIELGVMLDIPDPENVCGFVCCDECHLEPVYDGDEKSSWSECAWKPNPKLIEYHDKTTKKEKV
jgi:hypothetical protein